jgi:hypothetical protein
VFLKLTDAGELVFEDRHNFRAFKLVLAGGQSRLDEIRKSLAGTAELPDAATAWISQDALRRWPDLEHDAEWQRNFSAMIEKARPHGWIDDQRNAIKAHIEWIA